MNELANGRRGSEFNLQFGVRGQQSEDQIEVDRMLVTPSRKKGG
jgi:hypothetical protein